jgi:hypothetical protein
MAIFYSAHHCKGDGDSHKNYDEKDEHLPGLIHGM